MKNLVSRNPIQRFKQGRKIVKAEDGWRLINGKAIKLDTNPNVKQSSQFLNAPTLTQRYAFKGKQYGSFDGGKSYYSLDSGKPLDSKSNTYLLSRINYTPEKNIKKDTGKGIKTETGKGVGKGTTYQDEGFMGVKRGGNVTNFNNAIKDDQKAKLIASGSFTDADFANTTTFQNALNRYFGKDGLGSVIADGMWGNQTQKAFDMAMQKVNAPVVNTTEGIKFQGERPSLVPKVNLDITTTPRIKMPESPVNFGYRTSNTYEGNDFYDRLKTMGIGSNADLIDFMHKTNGENYNWNGDNWAKQFRSDVNQALGGDYSDANIRKVFNTAGNWGRGFLGRGDIGDFQNVLQTRAGAWNGEYDRNYDRNLNKYIKNDLGNQVKNIDWSKFKLFKQGGQLISKDPIKRFKQRNFRLVAQ